MMPAIMAKRIRPVEQSGKVTIFARRKPEEGSVGKVDNINTVNNFIRMLDGEGYPRAFLDHNKLHLEFSNAKIINDSVTANVEIRVKPL
jgi:methionyl-tRNA formyltransferase